MRVHFDPAADALYVRLDESPVIETEEVHPGVMLDFNADNEVVGIEILSVQARVPTADLKHLQFDVA